MLHLLYLLQDQYKGYTRGFSDADVCTENTKAFLKKGCGWSKMIREADLCICKQSYWFYYRMAWENYKLFKKNHPEISAFFSLQNFILQTAETKQTIFWYY